MSGLFDHERLTEADVPAVPLPERRRDHVPPPRAPERDPEPTPEQAVPEQAEHEPVDTEPEAEAAPVGEEEQAPAQHADGSFRVPSGYSVLEGSPSGERAVGVVVSRFNAEITTPMLEAALEELDRQGVARTSVTVMPVPGAFELPLGAMALAKTRRFACIVALGCVIRGETAHFEYVAGEAASGLQLAGIETCVPVAFGVLTTETREQAEARVDRAADAARSALEMADVFAKLRAGANAQPAAAAGG
jgi:6,7-dimethyl-8-ribityllumazine synthase